MADHDKGSMRAAEIESLLRAREQRYCRQCGVPIELEQARWMDGKGNAACEDTGHWPAPALP